MIDGIRGHGIPPHGKGFFQGNVQKGTKDPFDYFAEYISKGAYRYAQFRPSQFIWSDSNSTSDIGDLNDESEQDNGNEESQTSSSKPGSRQPKHKRQMRVPFDAWNQKHITLLNKWWRQNRVRITNELVRPKIQKWTAEEKQCLYKLSKELLEELKMENPDKTEEELLPMTITDERKEEWARCINKCFAGKPAPGSNDPEPRRERKIGAIMTMRTRVAEIVRVFKVAPIKGKAKASELDEDAEEEDKSAMADDDGDDDFAKHEIVQDEVEGFSDDGGEDSGSGKEQDSDEDSNEDGSTPKRAKRHSEM